MANSRSMFMLLNRFVAAGAILVLTTVPSLRAQEIPGGQSASEMASRSEALRRSIAREAARLAEGRAGAASSQSQDEPDSSWVGRHPVLTGALAGAAAGATWAKILCRGACEGDARPYMALFGGAGAGIGAGIGAVIAAIRR
jgi:hypothetical protein